jgi:hypothetical protein
VCEKERERQRGRKRRTHIERERERESEILLEKHQYNVTDTRLKQESMLQPQNCGFASSQFNILAFPSARKNN